MNVQFDAESGAAYWKVSEKAVVKTVEVSSHILCDIDAAGNLCGLEFLNYSPVQWAEVEKNLLAKST